MPSSDTAAFIHANLPVLPLARLDEIARYEVAETGGATRPSGVFRFRRERTETAPRAP